MQIKAFLNYFALKMILLNTLENVTLYWFKYFVLHIMVIPQNIHFYTTGWIDLPSVA